MWIVLIFALICVIPVAYASHGGGTSGGCSGDCTPPTLGTDNSGKQMVRGGISINGESFDVTHYKQELPTQVINVGEQITITLTIKENTGPQELEYVGLMLGLEEKLVSGVRVPTHAVEMHWNKDAKNIAEPDGFITDVNITESVNESYNIVTFQFTPIVEFDTSTIIVHMWDMQKNAWTNHFTNAIKLTSTDIPEWVKNNAAWWADGSINDDTFVQGLQYLITNDILVIPPTIQESDDGEIPEWVKNNAAWWADGSINDDTFVQGLQYLITIGVIYLQ